MRGLVFFLTKGCSATAFIVLLFVLVLFLVLLFVAVNPRQQATKPEYCSPHPKSIQILPL